MPAHRDAVRTVRDGDVEVMTMQSAERKHRHAGTGNCVGETVPPERRDAGVRRRRKHRSEHHEIDIER